MVSTTAVRARQAHTARDKGRRPLPAFTMLSGLPAMATVGSWPPVSTAVVPVMSPPGPVMSPPGPVLSTGWVPMVPVISPPGPVGAGVVVLGATVAASVVVDATVAASVVVDATVESSVVVGGEVVASASVVVGAVGAEVVSTGGWHPPSWEPDPLT